MTLVLVMTGFSGIGVYWVVNIGARQEFQYHPELDDFFCVLAAVSHTGTSPDICLPRIAACCLVPFTAASGHVSIP